MKTRGRCGQQDVCKKEILLMKTHGRTDQTQIHDGRCGQQDV